MYTSKSRLRRARRPAHNGFTLIELLLVLVILAILAVLVVQNLTGRAEQARVTAAKADISAIKSALALFEQENGRFPTSEEGLQALIENPGNLSGWKHRYLEKIQNDPWGHQYVYRCPGSNGKDFDLLSDGPDGREGGGDDVDP